MQLPNATTQCFADAQQLAAAATEWIIEQANAALTARGVFRLVLAGGTTPAAIYRQLGALDQDWRGWQFYFGDERCLPVADPERNSQLAATTWFEPAGIDHRQIVAIPAECGPVEAARRYAQLIQTALPFDLVLLGMGEDGHTASLFPDGCAFTEQQLTLAVTNAPKPPPQRVSLTPTALAASRQRLLLVTGESKRRALHAWQQGVALPIAEVAKHGSLNVFVDQVAT